MVKNLAPYLLIGVQIEANLVGSDI